MVETQQMMRRKLKANGLLQLAQEVYEELQSANIITQENKTDYGLLNLTKRLKQDIKE